MAKLHELLAVEQDLLKTATAMTLDAQTTFAKKPDHFLGQTRSTTYFADERSPENTSETKAIVTNVDERLGYALRHFGKYIDAVLQKDVANTQAKADLIVNGVTLATGVPGVYLLGLEQKLLAIRPMIEAIPTLAPGVVWKTDDQAGPGYYVSDPSDQIKTEKVQEHKVLYDATDKHPAQIKEYTVDKNVAKISTIHRSGMWTPLKKATVLGNLDTMIQAVKKARMRANAQEVGNETIADKLLAALLA
ncbi:hypothetical protein EVB27_107 [Rhizobium phage RHph_TM16]|nr:hypothetical protein EVB27_107 [Rhizobium phage RHph_TM16]